MKHLTFALKWLVSIIKLRHWCIFKKKMENENWTQTLYPTTKHLYLNQLKLIIKDIIHTCTHVIPFLLIKRKKNHVIPHPLPRAEVDNFFKRIKYHTLGPKKFFFLNIFQTLVYSLFNHSTSITSASCFSNVCPLSKMDVYNHKY